MPSRCFLCGAVWVANDSVPTSTVAVARHAHVSIVSCLIKIAFIVEGVAPLAHPVAKQATPYARNSVTVNVRSSEVLRVPYLRQSNKKIDDPLQQKLT